MEPRSTAIGNGIRDATSADCQAVYDLICEMERTELPFKEFRCLYFKQVINPRYECLVYEREGSVIGTINIRYEHQLHHAACVAEILEWAVASSARGEGIGRLLFSAACNHARNSGCVLIEIATDKLRDCEHCFCEFEGLDVHRVKLSKHLTGKVATNSVSR